MARRCDTEYVLRLGLEAERPCVLDVHGDPNVPPLPPHIGLEQAKGYMSSMLKGDPNRLGGRPANRLRPAPPV